MNQHPCNTPAELAQRLAAWIGLRLHQAIEQRGHAVLAVSGGKSPVPLFEALRTQPLEWSRVSITLVDERCVPHDHADSNTALVRAHLLQQNAAAASFVPWFDGLPDTLDDKALKTLADGASHRLAREPWPWDLAILGMGEDGHTASLFPDSPNLEAALDPRGARRCLPMQAPSVPRQRLSMSLALLASARLTLLALHGPGKLATLNQALAGESYEAMPIRAFLARPLEIYWCP